MGDGRRNYGGINYDNPAEGVHQEYSSGNAHVAVQNQIIPPQQIIDITGGAGSADNDVLYTSVDVSGYNCHIIENRSAVAIDVFVTLDGTFNASQPAASVVLTDAAATTTTSATIPANKTGVLRGKFKNIKIQQAAAGTISSGDVVGLHGVV